MDSLRIAHLSDPHFSKLTYHLGQFLSKRWIGNFNLLLFRKSAYQTAHLWHLPELLEDLKVESVFITGDFSSTSLDEEFSEGRCFVQAFQAKGIPTFALPGNHDCYTRDAEQKQSFYSFFNSDGMREKKVTCTFLGKGWWYIGLDCAVASPPFCAYGNFCEKTAQHLQEILLTIPKTDRVIVANHFPLFTTKRHLHDLKQAHKLQEILKAFPQIALYLHGHDHAYYVIDRQQEGYPLVLNSGSCAHKPDGTFFLIDLFEHECLVQRLLFRKAGSSFSWVIDWQKHYPLMRTLAN